MPKREPARSRDELSTPSLSTMYLFLYNFVQAIGWTAVAVLALMHYAKHHSYVGLYDDIKFSLNIFQTLGLLEVVHSAVGIVRSNPALTAVQLASRVFLIWGVLYVAPESRDQMGVPLICIAWCVTEIIRYTFYMGTIAKTIPFLLQYARYTLFIVLYPMGVCGELLCIYHALPAVKERRILSVALPNAFNVSFNYYYALIVIGFSYLPLFPKLYCHMLALRKKVLGGSEKSTKRD